MRADELSSRAREIHFSSVVFDTHADTPQRLFFDQFDLGKRDTEGCVDIPRLHEGGVGAIFFALWVPVEITGGAATRRAWDLLDAVVRQIEVHGGDLSLATSSEQVRAARAKKKIAVLLGIEGGHAIHNDLAVLREFHARGVRYLTLTHNAATDWADSSNDAPRHHGLTEFGKQVVREMNRLGMLIDVSHASDRTVHDVLEISRAPVIASHSCCQALCDAPRNLDDAMIQSLASGGGVIHITFHDGFLSQEYANANRALASEIASNEQAVSQTFGENEARNLMELQRLSDESIRAGKLPQVSWEKIVDHIEHAVRIAGADCVGVGSDFDGAFMPAGMEDASKFPLLTEGLLERGYREGDIRKILGENTLRVIGEVEGIGQRLRSEKS
ncbi:MAG TPA: dipeptidase [Candidatus Acidoferrales bacterium]|jgi:membrane dipeptidase|nr:dipeptidase [Candidatus Acidoferrales bacterium]